LREGDWAIPAATFLVVVVGVGVAVRVRRLIAQAAEPVIGPGGPQGIGGWLIPVAIGLVASPLLLLRTLAAYLPLFEPGAWQVLTAPGGPTHNPLLAQLLLSEVAFTIVQLIASGFLLYLFGARKAAFPIASVAYLGASLTYS
jgi:hypothetical protein